MTRTCIRCGSKFEISEAEREYYEKNNMGIPAHCYKCRKHNRIVKKEEIAKRRFGGLFPRREKKGARKANVFLQAFRGRYMVVMLAALLLFSAAVGRRMEKNYDAGRASRNMQGKDDAPGGEGGTSGDASGELPPDDAEEEVLIFRNFALLEENFGKYGGALGIGTAEDYLAAANALVKNPEARHEKKGGRDVYVLEASGECVVVAGGYIETYKKGG